MVERVLHRGADDPAFVPRSRLRVFEGGVRAAAAHSPLEELHGQRQRQLRRGAQLPVREETLRPDLQAKGTHYRHIPGRRTCLTDIFRRRSVSVPLLFYSAVKKSRAVSLKSKAAREITIVIMC